MTEESLFLAALDRTDPDDRRRFLDDACAADADLRKRLDVLLAAFAAGKHRLEPPTQPTADYQPGPEPGTVVAGRYTLVERIGEGGMGEVWVAKQTEPVHRKVALKLIKPGMDSKSVLNRFEAERQALALMDHPNIAKVLDGGLTADGRPYFVMELVNGQPLTKFCDEAKLTPRQRLELFVPVCQAVQHAHQKGIVHRDLKPSNILVTLYDGRSVPKVIDFGLAKATGGRLTDQTVSTQFGAVVGTFEYMAPEQAGLSALDVDTRADIYSLGVVLYELLTGLRPFDGQRLRRAALDELARILREEEPPRPSTRLSSDDARPSLSAVRGTDPHALAALLRRDLDWVVMKCLEKDRARRYETANGLARDIQRYLADEAVEARPPGRGYRARKFVRRNRGPVVAAIAVVAAVLAGTVGTAWQAVQARRAEAAATDDKAAAIAAGQTAISEGNAARTAAAEAREASGDMEAINAFLVNDVLSAARPRGERGGLGTTVTVKAALDAAGPNLARTFAGRAKAEAAARHALGVTYRLLGDYPAAALHLRRAVDLRRQVLGPDNPATRESENSLAIALWFGGDTLAAEPLLTAALDHRRRRDGADHRDTLTVQTNLGGLYRDLDRLDEADRLLTTAADACIRQFGADDPTALFAASQLASLRRVQGKLGEAERLLTAARPHLIRRNGDGHPDVVRNSNELAIVYSRQGQHVRAEELLREATAVGGRVLGEDHRDTLITLVNLAGVYHRQRRTDEADRLLRKVLDVATRAHGPADEAALLAATRLAERHRDRGEFGPAEELFAHVLQARRSASGDDHPRTLLAMSELADVQFKAGRFEPAERLWTAVVEARTRLLGADHRLTIVAKSRLAHVCQARGRTDRAIELAEEVRAWDRRTDGPTASTTRMQTNILAFWYRELGQRDRAEKYWAEVWAVRPAGEADAITLAAVNNLALLYEDQARFAEAEPLLRAYLAIQEQSRPNEWTTFRIKGRLGAVLAGQGRFVDAEPLVRAGYDGLKARLAAIPPPARITQMTSAAERLVRLYDAWGKPAEAAKWRKELPPTERGPTPRAVR